MPVMFSYNFTGHEGIDNNHIQSMFERFGWKNVGGSCYRYPPLGSDPLLTEDWLNRVIPALMLFRAYVLKTGVTVSRFSLDAHSSTGHDGKYGDAPVAQPVLMAPVNGSFGVKNLEEWLDGVTAAVAY